MTSRSPARHAAGRHTDAHRPRDGRSASNGSTPNRYFEIRRSSIQGRGAFALRRLRVGTRLIEYVGERITPEAADERYDEDLGVRHHTFLFSVDSKTVIDAAVDGNEARFINHSCNPNCEAVDEDGRIFIEVIRTIQPGEELSYDYQYERDEEYDEEWEAHYICKCGAENCRGTILAPPKKKRSRSAGKSKQKKATRTGSGKRADAKRALSRR